MASELGLDINDTEFEDAQALSKQASKGFLKKGNKTIVKLDVHDIANLERTQTFQRPTIPQNSVRHSHFSKQVKLSSI